LVCDELWANFDFYEILNQSVGRKTVFTKPPISNPQICPTSADDRYVGNLHSRGNLILIS